VELDMTCKLERPDPQALFNRYLNLFSSTVLGGASIIPESNEWYAASVNYAIAEQLYAVAEQAWKERDPREACCENLQELAAANGVYPRPAVFAQGYVKLTGTANTPLPSPLQFAIGLQNFITASVTTQPSEIGANGTVVIRVRALVAGPAGNTPGATGSMTTVVAGVSATVQVCGGSFCNGAVAEECEAFRARYLRRLQYNPRATNTWIIDKILEWPCATRALQRAGSCCRCADNLPADCENCGCKDCGGKMEFYVMFDNSFPCGIAPPGVVAEIQQWLFGSPQGYGLGQVEIGICGRVFAVNPLPIDLYIDIADCISTTQRTAIQNQIREFFSTISPSILLSSRSIETIIAGIVGADKNFSSRFELVDPLDAVNTSLSSCDLEPNCDFLPCVRNIYINQTGSGEGVCL